MAGRYPNPYNALRAGMASSGASDGKTQRDKEVAELLREVPDCRQLYGSGTFTLDIAAPNSSQNVTLRIEVPTTYPQTKPTFSVDHAPPLTFLDSRGHFSHSPHRPGMTLAESVRDAFELICGRAYTPPAPSSAATASAAYATPDRAGGSATAATEQGTEPAALEARIRADLMAKSADELAVLASDDDACAAVIERWMAETPMGKRYVAGMARVRELVAEDTTLREQITNVEQQLHAASATELATAQAEYDAAFARQRAVTSKIDVGVLVDTMRATAQSLDRGEDEERALERGGSGGPLSAWDVRNLVSKYREKREALHMADIKATAAAQLPRG